jgi:transcriptional regulator with XRE-family HTH domain
MVPSRFGELLRQLRAQADLTYDELAECSGLSVRTIGRLETAEVTNPTTRTVSRLADALRLSDDQRQQLLAVAAGRDPETEQPERDSAARPPEQRESWRLPLAGPVAAAAEEFAMSVGIRWQREYEHQQLHGTFPLPVRWSPAGAAGSERLDDSHAVPIGAPAELKEQLTTVAGFYRRLPSGRLVITGEAGSGKTMLAIRLVLELFAHRSAAEPVPVFVGVRSWNPATTTFHDWLADQLLRDYPSLAATRADGSTLSAALVQTHTILPVLDGFDEIAPGLQPQALLMLDRTKLPLVLTSRPSEYDEAVQTAGLRLDAAVVRLGALTARELANYLPHDAEGLGIPGATVWKPLVDELTAEPPSAAAKKVAEALRTPLMVSLVRIVYGDSAGRSPAELLVDDRFPESADIEEHLLSGYLPTVYEDWPRDAVRGGDRPHWQYDRVEKWLRYLARHAQQLQTSDLAWWQLGNELNLWTRALVVAFAAGLGVFAVGVVLGAPLFALADGQPLWPVVRMQCVNGVLNAVVAAPLAALVYALARRSRAVMPHPARIRLRGRAWLGPALPVARLRLRVLLALFGGLAFGAGVALLAGVLRRAEPATIIAEMITMGAVVAIALAAAVGIVSWVEAPADVEAAADPSSFLRASRTTVLTQILLGGLILGLIGGLGVRPVEHLVFDAVASGGGSLFFDPAYELGLGLIAGLSGALAFGLTLTAWGQWVVLVRLWLPLTGRLPWSLMRFLDDAYDRGVLRQAGPVHQFRHARLQSHLVNQPSTTPPGPDRVPDSPSF